MENKKEHRLDVLFGFWLPYFIILMAIVISRLIEA